MYFYCDFLSPPQLLFLFKNLVIRERLSKRKIIFPSRVSPPYALNVTNGVFLLITAKHLAIIFALTALITEPCAFLLPFSFYSML